MPPLAQLADELFWAHMVEHLMLGDLAALLIVLGLTGPLIGPLLRIPWLGWLRVLAHPVIAFSLWALGLYAWHIPALHEAAVRHDGVHVVQHACFIALGINMWMALLGPFPQARLVRQRGDALLHHRRAADGRRPRQRLRFRRRSPLRRRRPGRRPWNISPAGDQVAAGAVMMVEGSLVTLGLFCWLFLRAARQTDERQELVEFARERGVDLSPERAGRAVAAGRADDLRERIAGDGAGGPFRELQRVLARRPAATWRRPADQGTGGRRRRCRPHEDYERPLPRSHRATDAGAMSGDAQPLAARLYVAAMIAVGWRCSSSWRPTRTPTTPMSPLVLAVMALAVMVGEFVTVKMGPNRGEVAPSNTFAFALLLIGGPAIAILAMFVACTLADLGTARPCRRWRSTPRSTRSRSTSARSPWRRRPRSRVRPISTCSTSPVWHSPAPSSTASTSPPWRSSSPAHRHAAAQAVHL